VFPKLARLRRAQLGSLQPTLEPWRGRGRRPGALPTSGGKDAKRGRGRTWPGHPTRGVWGKPRSCVDSGRVKSAPSLVGPPQGLVLPALSLLPTHASGRERKRQRWVCQDAAHLTASWGPPLSSRADAGVAVRATARGRGAPTAPHARRLPPRGCSAPSELPVPSPSVCAPPLQAGAARRRRRQGRGRGRPASGQGRL
jgi:hypothetical protein